LIENIFKLTTSTNRRIQQKFVPTPPIGSTEKEKELKKDMQRQHMLDRIAESEDRAQAKREYRHQAHINREREIEESLQRAEREKQMRQEAHEQEERLARELERYKLDQLRDAKMRQQLRESR
jgi:hypothetical protein